MKRTRGLPALLLAIGTLLAVCGVSFSLAAPDSGAWYAEAVEYVRDRGIMNGTMPTTFAPERIVTRGQFAAVLYRNEGAPAIADAAPFPDVSASSYSYPTLEI